MKNNCCKFTKTRYFFLVVNFHYQFQFPFLKQENDDHKKYPHKYDFVLKIASFFYLKTFYAVKNDVTTFFCNKNKGAKNNSIMYQLQPKKLFDINTYGKKHNVNNNNILPSFVQPKVYDWSRTTRFFKIGRCLILLLLLPKYK